MTISRLNLTGKCGLSPEVADHQRKGVVKEEDEQLELLRIRKRNSLNFLERLTESEIVALAKHPVRSPGAREWDAMASIYLLVGFEIFITLAFSFGPHLSRSNLVHFSTLSYLGSNPTYLSERTSRLLQIEGGR